MSMDDSYMAKTQAIRACVAQHPALAPERIVGLLAAGGMRVSHPCDGDPDARTI
jgi:hypothetical protein